MNIEKIKNYNQKMLALLCTLGAILLLVSFIMVVIEMLPIGGYYDDKPAGLLSEDRVESLNQENLRKQILSYGTPWLIDTLKFEYIIPVSVKTLKKPKEVVRTHPDQGLMSLMDVYPSFKSESEYYERKYFEGSYANLILYKPLENVTKSLFSERILIGGVQTFYFEDDIVLVFFSAEKDTDKNGIIDLNDHLNLCLYSLNNETIKKISDGDNSIETFSFIDKSKDLLIEFKLGQYKNNQFDNYHSPRKIMRYKFDAQKLVEIVPVEIQNDLQKLVEGK